MKFSLKTFLITTCVVGAVFGVMGRLLLEQPEVFQRVLMLGATVGPFLLAVGTIIWLGCQVPRRRKLVAWGCCLLLTPLVVFGAMALLWPSGNPLKILTTRRLIEQRLPGQIEAPWVWRELADRVNKGKLSREQVSDAINVLVSHMTTTQPKGWNQPLSWQKDFLLTAGQAKLVSDEVLLKLCDAFFGSQPVVDPIPPVMAGSQGMSLEVKYGNPWTNNSGLGVELLWDVKQVSLDGTPINLKQSSRHSQNWSLVFTDPLTAGDHEFQFEIECAYVDESKLGGMSGSQIPLSRWPRAKKRWTTIIKVPVKATPVPGE